MPRWSASVRQADAVGIGEAVVKTRRYAAGRNVTRHVGQHGRDHRPRVQHERRHSRDPRHAIAGGQRVESFSAGSQAASSSTAA